MGRAHQVEDALREADPDGTNKQLKKLGVRFQAAVSRMKRISEDAEQLEDATNYMIQAFENGENDVIRLINNLNPGRGTEDKLETIGGDYMPDRLIEPPIYPPITFPRPYIAPTMRFSALGPVMDWMEALMDRA
jgi:hypothetical protein